MLSGKENQAAAVVPFNYHSHEIRTVEIDGEVWFVAQDVCDILDHSNVRMAVKPLDEDEAGVSKVYTRSSNGVEQIREVSIISESGLYALLLRSNKPEAKPFRRWVTKEVLPQIRRTGSYEVAATGALDDVFNPLVILARHPMPALEHNGRSYYCGADVRAVWGLTNASWSKARERYSWCFFKNEADGKVYITTDYIEVMGISKLLNGLRKRLREFSKQEETKQLADNQPELFTPETPAV